jgi:YbbR-like protein
MVPADPQPKRAEPRRLFFRHIIRKVFLEDWALKLLALVITLGLWFGVTGLSTPASKRLTVQLVPNVSNNIEITNNPISEVEIVISGDERKLRPLTGTGIVAALDLTQVQPGDRVISLTPENVSVDLPLGIKLDEIQPSRIAVRLESVEERELPVKADLDGKPADGFEIYSQVVLPQRVRVRGPSSFVKTLDFVLTDKISVAGKAEDFTARQVPLGVSNQKTTVFNTVVDVVVRIGEQRAERIYAVPLTGPFAGKKALVTLFAPKSMLAKLRLTDFKVEAARSETGEETTQVILPPEFQSTVEIKKVKVQ